MQLILKQMLLPSLKLYKEKSCQNMNEDITLCTNRFSSFKLSDWIQINTNKCHL